MTGTPLEKKDPDPMVGGRISPDDFQEFNDVAARMKRKPASVVQELVRGFLEYSKDGKAPNFPLVVSAESYRDKDGEVIVAKRGNKADPYSEIATRLARIEACCEEMCRLSSASEIVKGVGAALRGAASRSGSRVPLPPSGPESKQTEHHSHAPGSPQQSEKDKPGGRAGERRGP